MLTRIEASASFPADIHNIAMALVRTIVVILPIFMSKKQRHQKFLTHLINSLICVRISLTLTVSFPSDSSLTMLHKIIVWITFHYCSTYWTGTWTREAEDYRHNAARHSRIKEKFFLVLTEQLTLLFISTLSFRLTASSMYRKIAKKRPEHHNITKKSFTRRAPDLAKRANRLVS